MLRDIEPYIATCEHGVILLESETEDTIMVNVETNMILSINYEYDTRLLDVTTKVTRFLLQPVDEKNADRVFAYWRKHPLCIFD